MTDIDYETVKKRGCNFCTEMSEKVVYSYYTCGYKKVVKKRMCRHEICPFREIDKAGTFNQYLKGFKKNTIKA